MPHVIEKTVYTFTELECRAEERATEWYLEGMNDD
jgi:hypothetical protein